MQSVKFTPPQALPLVNFVFDLRRSNHLEVPARGAECLMARGAIRAFPLVFARIRVSGVSVIGSYRLSSPITANTRYTDEAEQADAVGEVRASAGIARSSTFLFDLRRSNHLEVPARGAECLIALGAIRAFPLVFARIRVSGVSVIGSYRLSSPITANTRYADEAEKADAVGEVHAAAGIARASTFVVDLRRSNHLVVPTTRAAC